MSNQDLHCRNFTTKRSEPVYSNNGKLMIDVGELGLNTTDTITHQELQLLKKEDVNYINYEISTIGSTLWADSVNPYIQDPVLQRQGWYYVNSPNVGGSNLYWYSSDAPYSFKSGSELTLQNLTIDGGFYSVMWIDKVNTTDVLPIFAIYTTSTGVDDYAPGFYKSRLTYEIQDAKLYSGEIIVLYSNVSILDKIKNVYPNARRILLTQTTVNGGVLSAEKIRYLTINGDSGASLNTQQWVINSCGWYDGLSTLNHYKFVVNASSGGSMTNYALESSQLNVLSNVNSVRTNTSDTAVNTLDIGNNTSNIDTQFNVLNSETLSIKNNTGDIAVNTLGISNDTININSNLGIIKTNTDNIDSNTLDIATNTDEISFNTGNIDGKLTFGHIEDITNALQTAIYARHQNTHNDELGALHITTGHNLCISIQDLEGVEGQKSMALSMPVVLATDQTDINTRRNSVLNLGSYNNLNNDTTILAGELGTLEADITNISHCHIVYTDSSTGVFDSVGVEVSGDGGTHWHEIGGIYPNTTIGEFVRRGYTSFNVGGFTLLRIRNKSSDNAFNNVQASVYGSP